MIRVLAEAEKNIKCAVANVFNVCRSIFEKERGELMVEYDNMKLTLSEYEKPLLEMGNSL